MKGEDKRLVAVRDEVAEDCNRLRVLIHLKEVLALRDTDWGIAIALDKHRHESQALDAGHWFELVLWERQDNRSVTDRILVVA